MPALTTVQIQRHINVLRSVFLFNGYDDGQITTLLTEPGSALIRAAQGGQLLKSGERSLSLIILLRGGAIVEKLGGKNKLIMSELKPGGVFGMASIFLDGATQPTTITAAKETVALIISEARLKEIMQADFRIAENYIKYLTGRIHFLNSRIEEFITPDIPERLLLYIRKHTGTIECSMTELAKTLSVSRATLYRALTVLEERGSITRNGGGIQYIHD